MMIRCSLLIIWPWFWGNMIIIRCTILAKISERVEQALVHSYAMAYGGAGLAISYPLAAELVRVLDGCIDRYEELLYGSDQKIQGCLCELVCP